MGVEKIWDIPKCVNDGVFISEYQGKQVMYELENGCFILPVNSSETFYDDIVDFIIKHYSHRGLNTIEDIKDRVDVTDNKRITMYFG